MKKVAVVTDSNSGITQAEAKELGIFVLPMPFTIDGKEYFEDIDLSQEEFYKKLTGDSDISTSQPSPASVMRHWDEILSEYDELVDIPMSSGLSGTCATAKMLSADYDGRVEVVNNQRISVTMRESVMDAIELVKQGFSAAQIREQLEAEKLESSIYITVTTLKYLKKGGRVTPAAAAIGGLLHIKPVLQIQGERLDSFAKVRTMVQAKSTMINAVKKDLETRFGGIDAKDATLAIAHTNNYAEAEKFKAEVEAEFPGYEVAFVNPLSLSVSCHIGDGALALTVTKKHAWGKTR